MKGSNICKHSLCTGCAACMNVCPKKVIEMSPDWRGFLYPKVNEKACVDCGLCKLRCPANASSKSKYEFKSAYVFIDKDKQNLLNASSGGAFGVIARYVLNHGGVVFGVSMNNEYDVNIIKAETPDELLLLHGSKYVQTNVGYAYDEIKEQLNKGREVLFCGCPCHVAALKSVLNKDYENLITMDLVCHGVPSQKYFKDYVKDIKTHNRQIDGLKFRWKTNPEEKIQKSLDGTKNYYVAYRNWDYYMIYFFWGKGYRNSCYLCRYAGEVRNSDFTIGDFWQNKRVKLPIDVTYGSSTIYPNTIKAQRLLYLYKEAGTFIKLKSLEDAAGKDGSHLMHPSKNDIRTNLIHLLYKLLGVNGVKLLFFVDQLRMKK